MLKIEQISVQKVFITSDTHYNHKNICRGTTEWDLERVSMSTTRDFKDLGEMNDRIVDNINDSVGYDDILIHLGDWSFGGFDKIKEFRDRIVCQNIHLITGNHDHHIERNKDNIQELFSSVHIEKATLEFKYTSYMKGDIKTVEIQLSHYPYASWNHMNKGHIHLFGHVHLPPLKKVMEGRSMDVGIDGNYYYPYNIHECISLLEKHPIRPTVLPSDHHAHVN